MTSYTEEEIIRGIGKGGLSSVAAGTILMNIREIAGKKNDHSHDWSDDDMISVKEIREAWARGNSTPARNSLPNFLTDISEHREHFEENSVVQDPEGNIWKLKGSPGRWFIFGSTMNVDYYTPRRPLKLLGVDARRG
jgi:hypothetical protein